MAPTPVPVPVLLTPREIGRYGELDPFGGGISSDRAELPRLVRELKLYLLVKDVVVLAPNELLEHSLTLPACEALAPFVRAGRLTTTAERRVPRPMALIEEQVSRHREATRRSLRHAVARARREEISAIVDRWHALLPTSWTLHRDVPAQIAGFTESMLGLFARMPHITSAATTLRDLLAEHKALGRPLDRHTVLAHVAALRRTTPPAELARLCFAVQATYFEAGAKAHATCTLYPGAFARLARRPGAGPAELEPLPVDWDATPSKVEERLRHIGLDPERLLALPPEVLYELASSAEWLAVRTLLHGEPAPPEVDRAVAGLFGRHGDPIDALPLVPAVLGSSAPRLPSRWQLAASAMLRIPGLRSASEPEVGPTLDLATLVLDAPGCAPRAVTASHGHLLTILAAAGQLGLSIFDLEELCLDGDRIDGTPDGRFDRRRATHPEPGPASPGRVRGLVCRVNEALEPFELRITAPACHRAGRYAITDLRGAGRHLGLRGTLWALLGTAEAPPAPVGLSAQQVRLWCALAGASPYSVTAQQLTGALGRTPDAQGVKQITDTLARLGRKLVALAVPWRVIRLHRGEYALLPLQAAAHSEVR